MYKQIDYSLLMDLRVDFAFKIFIESNPGSLVSLLNSIFANKKIPRIVKSATLKNTYLDKKSTDDKLSILDVRAELDDGTNVLIELHMYGLGELKSKTIRSWARAHGEELEVGQTYSAQPPTITIAFTNGSVEPIENNKNANTNKDKIHRLCMIMDVEDFTVFTNAMELHYIDMKAFANAVNEADSININDTNEAMFAKWLSVITEKEIKNKAIIENACSEEEEIQMAVTALQRQSEDKLVRQAYLRRQDEIYFYNKELADNTRRMEQAERKAEQFALKAEQFATKAEQFALREDGLQAEIKELRQKLAELEAK